MEDNELLEENNGVGGGDVFVYTGEEYPPRDVKRVRIAENVYAILARAFRDCNQLIEVEGHNRLRKVEQYAFTKCPRLRRLSKMTGVIDIENEAFFKCPTLSVVDFEKLEIIGAYAFGDCFSLRPFKMTSIRWIHGGAFMSCHALTDAVFGEKLERLEQGAFYRSSLRRITIPLKDNLIIGNICENLSRVDTLVGRIHKTISSLHMETWRNEMEEEIDRINQTLPNTHSTEKATAIQQWITRVLSRMEHYKTEHMVLVKVAMTLLELALWKAKLLNEAIEKKFSNVDDKAKIDEEAARKEHRFTCGASIVIKNVLPFLALK
jgi:hypothetical protein